VPGREPEEAATLVAPTEQDYVIDIFGLPAILLHRETARLERDLEKTAKLLVNGRSAVSAKSVRVPGHGMHLSATLRFPRFDHLGKEHDKIEFAGEAAGMKIAQAFRLNEMTYHGVLEL
jgi:hypothetical protein